MMEQEHFDEAEYIRGFNLGYQVMKQYPEMGEVIAHSHLKGDKFDGINDGRSQYLEETMLEQEKNQEQDTIKHAVPEKENDQLQSWLSDERLNEIDRQVSPNKEKGMEPEL